MAAEKKYLLNKETGVLHIKDYCWHAKHPPCHVRWFDTENEAYKEEGRAIRPCKLCEKIKEDKIKNQ